MDIQKLLDILKGDHVYIQTHDYPDPDAIASAYGLQNFLARFGIVSSICFMGASERASVNNALKEFNIQVATYEEAVHMKETEKIILVDGQKRNANMTDLPGNEVACIDHHPVFQHVDYPYADIRLVGSCASIITDYYLTADIPIPKDVATLLLYGLHIDTNFMTRGVADLDLDIFPKLYRMADQRRLELVEARSLEFSDLKAFGAAINSVQVFGRTGFVGIPFSCPDALIAQVADFILSLAEVDIAIIYARRGNGIKFSVRSVLESVHSGNMLAEILPPYGNGGGHARMAGGFVRLENVQQSGLDEAGIIKLLEERMLAYIDAHQQKDVMPTEGAKP